MAAEEVHDGDIDTTFELTIKDDDVVVDVSGVATKQIKFKKPDGTVVTQTAAFKTDGTDGIITYTSIAGDLNAAGLWKMQAYVAWSGGWSGHSSTVSFRVHANVA